MNYKLVLACASVLVAGQVTHANPIEFESIKVYNSDLLEELGQFITNVVSQVTKAPESARHTIEEPVKSGLKVFKNTEEVAKEETEAKLQEINKAREEAREKGAAAEKCAKQHSQEINDIRESMRQELMKCANDYRKAVNRAGEPVYVTVAELQSLGGKSKELVVRCRTEHRDDRKAAVSCIIKGSGDLDEEARNVINELEQAVRTAETKVRAAAVDARECTTAAGKEGVRKTSEVTKKIRECIAASEQTLQF